MIHPGEIWLADLELAGLRPVVIVSRESLNRGAYAVVVPCTTSNFGIRSRLPNSVVLHAGQFGLSRDCVAQCEAIASVRIDCLQQPGPIGILDESTLRSIIRAIGNVLDAECEPA